METYIFFVYVLQSQRRNYFYVGLTNDIDRRFKQHQDGREKTTRAYRPYVILFTERFPTRILARQREKYLKSGAGKEYIKNIAGVAKLVKAHGLGP